MKLSIVTTLYHSENHILEFCQRAARAAKKMVDDSYEIILVNDGSPDNSLSLAVTLSEKDSHIVVVDFSRNFGHYKAMMTGLAYAEGDQIFLIDSDLEEDPALLNYFDEEMKQKFCDVVYGIQKTRKGGFFERWSGLWFWKLFNVITGIDLPLNIVTARLMSKRYVTALLRHNEREVFIAGLWHITGFKQEPVIVEKKSGSETTYSFRKKMSLLVNAITSFSNLPLKGTFYLGLLILCVSLAYIGYLIFMWLFFLKPLVLGWTSVIASIWFLGGLIMSSIGVLGIYLSKVFSEVKRRPYTIIRRVYGKDNINSEKVV